MGFGCPICSEKLDKLPAEGQGSGRSRGEINISATPCGHIFHAYCIQKWLTGNLASSKQCPCCRKPVPNLRCLSLFPTTFDESLDDSFSLPLASGSGGSSGSSVLPAPCNHGEIISSLKSQIDGLQRELSDKDQLYTLLSSDHDDLLQKYRVEKLESDMWMMKAKQYESYKDLAEEYQTRTEKAERQVKKFTQIENVIKGVEVGVNEEITRHSCTIESLRTLLEMKHILSSDLRSTSKKLEEAKSNIEVMRTEKMKLKTQLDNTVKDLKELKHVYEISRLNGRVRTTSPIPGPSGLSGDTPKVFRQKRRLQEDMQPASSSANNAPSPGVDSDVDLFPCGVKRSKQQTKKEKLKKSDLNAPIKFPCLLSPIPQTSTSKKSSANNKLNANDTITISDDNVSDTSILSDVLFEDEDDIKIRGNVPGAPLPIAASRMKRFQEKSQKPVLGANHSLSGNGNTKGKCFKFHKSNKK